MFLFALSPCSLPPGFSPENRFRSRGCISAGLLSGLAGGDQAHLVDLVGVAAAGQVVDGGVQTLEDGAVSGIAAQTLGDLIADVAGLDAGENEGVGLAGHSAALALGLGDLGRDRGVKPQIGRASCRERV